MRKDESANWVYALAVALCTTVGVARCAPDPERTRSSAPITSNTTDDLVPYEGWWKDRPQ
jgi:hypothetical protein